MKRNENIRNECLKRMRIINKAELNAQNMIEAVSTLTITTVRCSFNLLNLNLEDVSNIERKIRNIRSIKLIFLKLLYIVCT